MKPRILPILAVLGAAGAVGGGLPVVTTTSDLAALVREVGGDRVEVKVLCPGTQDPHYVDAKPTHSIVLRSAKLLVHVGLSLETGWLPLLIQGSRNADLNPGSRGNLDASEGVRRLEVPTGQVDRSLGDVHPEGNPHYWLAPENAGAVARSVAARLGELDPAGAAAYGVNLADFEKRLAAARVGWEEAAKGVKGRKVVVYHREFTYLCDWLGLEVADSVENRPGIKPSGVHLAELQERMKAQALKVLVASTFSNKGIADAVAERAGATVVVLPVSVGGTAEATDWFKLMDQIVGRLVAASW